MTRKRIIIIILLAIGVTAVYKIYTVFTGPPASPREQVEITSQGVKIVVDYSRPYKKERLIFGEDEAGALVPFGEYWRTGANAATTIKLSGDVEFAGEKLESGIYSLYTVPGPRIWEVHLNAEWDRWGYSDPDYDQDILVIKAESGSLNEPVEQFTITIEEAVEEVLLTLQWDTTELTIPIRVLHSSNP